MLDFDYLSIFIILSCSHRGSLGTCRIWSFWLKPLKRYGFQPKSKMVAGDHLGFCFLSILVIPPCSPHWSLGLCQFWSFAPKPFKRYGLSSWLQNWGRWPIFVNFHHLSLFGLSISRLVLNLKCHAHTVQNLWVCNRNPKWRPAAILDFHFCKFW